MMSCEDRAESVREFVREQRLPYPGLARSLRAVETLPSELQPPFSQHEACVVHRDGPTRALFAVVLVSEDGELFNAQSVDGFNEVLAREELVVHTQEEAFALAGNFRRLRHRGFTELFPTIRGVADIDGIDDPDEMSRLELQYGICAPSVSESAHEFRYEEFGWCSESGRLTRVRVLVSKGQPVQLSYEENVLEKKLGSFGAY